MDNRYRYVKIPGGCMGVLAEYKRHEFLEFQGNPLIEGIDFLSKTQAKKELEVYPPYDPSERQKDKDYRIDCVFTRLLFGYFKPLRNNFEFHQRFNQLMCLGYIGRNPYKPETIMQLNQNYQYLKSLNNEINTTTMGFTIIGLSGVGKSKGVKREFSMIPQIIVHETPINFYQITWLKLECPKTLKGLCIEFFFEVDRLLGTNFKKLASGNNSEAMMLEHMVQIAKLQYVGVLVIDEVQHLRTTKAGGAQSILEFFVSLVNKIGIPVILIGNPKALKVLQSEFSIARRGSSLGDMEWKRLKQNEEWDIFIEGMWKYQWTKEEVPLTQEFKNTLYEESQGIIDIAIKLYALTQRHVIYYGKDKFTPQTIKLIAKEYLKLVQGALEALKSGDESKIANYEDLCPIDLNDKIEKPFKIDVPKVTDVLIEGNRNNKKEPNSKLEQVVSALIKLEIRPEIAKRIANNVLSENEKISREAAIKEAIKSAVDQKLRVSQQVQLDKKKPRIKDPTKRSVESNPDGIKSIINRGREKKQSAYVALKEAGIVKSPFEVFRM
jgi:hypothetical protein